MNIQKLQTFELIGNQDSIQDLCDGVAVAHVLTQMYLKLI
jgi:hypothetical protein